MSAGNDGARADVELTEAERESLGLIVARYDHEDQSLTEWHPCPTCKGGPCACSGRPWLGDEMAEAIGTILAERLRQVIEQLDRTIARAEQAEAALAEARQCEERVRALHVPYDAPDGNGVRSSPLEAALFNAWAELDANAGDYEAGTALAEAAWAAIDAALGGDDA